MPPPAKPLWPSAATPVVIPAPKSLTLTGPRLRLNHDTRLAVADDATARDKMAALAVQQELLKRLGPPALRLVRAKSVTRADNVLVFGEAGRVPPGGAPAPTKSEGYGLRVGADWAVVAGHDPAGTFYGAQTLCQLVGTDTKGVFVWPTQIDDYPSLRWRGAHLYLGQPGAAVP